MSWFQKAPLKLAIIGGGPSSFYVASRLLSIFQQNGALSPHLRIHVNDRLWAPHGPVRYGVAPDHPEVKVCPRASIHMASLPSMAYTVPSELYTQVRSGRQRPPPTLFRECAGWAADTPIHPTRSPHIFIHPKVTLHTPPLRYRLRHPHATPRPVPFRPRDPCALARPLVHTATIASRAITPTRDGARLHHRSGQRRARRRTHTAHPALSSCQV